MPEDHEFDFGQAYKGLAQSYEQGMAQVRELIAELKHECPSAVPVVLTGHGTIEGLMARPAGAAPPLTPVPFTDVRIADAFSMMKQVLGNGTADHILTSGLTGEGTSAKR